MAAPTFTYGADPQNSPLDAVRLTLGDTDADDPLLYDGELAYYLSKASNDIPTACFQACGAIVAKLSRLCDETVGQVSLALSQKLRAYISLQDVLQRDIGQAASFYCGGISRSRMRQIAANPDRVSPQVPDHLTRPTFGRSRWAGGWWERF